jgi:hypothetical protein
MKTLKQQLFETSRDLQEFANTKILAVPSNEIVNITIEYGTGSRTDWFTLWWIETTYDEAM